jgi:hypothetical protein
VCQKDEQHFGKKKYAQIDEAQSNIADPNCNPQAQKKGKTGRPKCCWVDPVKGIDMFRGQVGCQCGPFPLVGVAQ